MKKNLYLDVLKHPVYLFMTGNNIVIIMKNNEEHAKNVTFKVKRVMGIIGKLGRIYKGIVGNVPVSPHPIKGVPEQIYTYLLSF